MPKFTYSNSQRIHNSLITRLIQSISNPLILFGVFSIVILSIYRSVCLKLDDHFRIENSLTKESNNITVTDVDFSIKNNNINLSDLLHDEIKTYLNHTIIFIKDDINSTCDYLSSQHDSISQMFNTTLEIKLNESSIITSNQLKIQQTLDSLNNTIIETLAKDKSSIDDMKDKLNDAVYVGNKVDTSGLSLNYDDIQTSLKDAINNNNDMKIDNSSLVMLNKTSDKFHNELNQLFDYAISEFKNYNETISNNKSSSSSSAPSYSIIFSPHLTNTDTKTLNHSNTSNISTTTQISYNKTFESQSKINLITIGAFLFISYFLIMIYQYFRFKYQLNYTVSKLVDLEKSETKVDYLGVVQSTNEPLVTMITDVQSQIFSNNNKTKNDKWFWFNSYLFGDVSNLPYLFMMCFIFLIMMLSFEKNRWNGKTANEVSSIKNNASYEILKDYELIKFDSMEDYNYTSTLIEDYNSQSKIQFQNITDSLHDLYNKYNLTNILGISTAINLTHHNLTTIKFHSQLSSSTFLQHLNEISFKINTKINTSSFQPTNILLTVTDIITTTFIHIIQITLVTSAISFLVILLLGFVYSFLI